MTPSILEAILWGKKELEKLPDPRVQAELLITHVVEKDRLYIHLHSAQRLTDAQWERFQKAVARRLRGEPLQYITGTQNFMGFDFEVTPDVLIPRQDTERLVEVVLDWTVSRHAAGELKIADLGTGSGAIAVALAKLIPSTHLYAVDISEAALRLAKKNALRLDAAGKITFLQGDLFRPLKPLQLEGSLDIIASNPPYIAFQEKNELEPVVRDHEPHLALFAPGEGLDFYRSIIPEAKTYLKRGGLLALEIGASQASSVKKIFEETAGYSNIAVFKDYAGLDRVVTAELE